MYQRQSGRVNRKAIARFDTIKMTYIIPLSVCGVSTRVGWAEG